MEHQLEKLTFKNTGRGRGQPTKRNVIVAAAELVFSEKGFGATTVDAIVLQARVSKRTFYQHFDNKDEIFLEIVRNWCGDILVPLHMAGRADITLSRLLNDIAHAYLEVMLSPAGRELFRIVVAEARRFPALARQFYEAGHEPAAAALATRLRDIYGANSKVGKLAGPIAEQYFVQVRGYLHERALLGICEMPSRSELNQCVDLAVSMFIGGLDNLLSTPN